MEPTPSPRAPRRDDKPARDIGADLGGRGREALLARIDAAALQLGILLVAIPCATAALGALYLLTGATLDRPAGLALLGLGVLSGGSISAGFGRRDLAWVLATGGVLFLGSLALCHGLLDLSYDGQGYHFDAVYALTHGWNPDYGDFGRHMSPGLVDHDSFARYWPKAGWIFSAVEASAGFSLEAAKNQALLLFGSVLLCVYAGLRRAGFAPVPALLWSAVAALNPVLVVQLFPRMNDGQLGACLTIFAALLGLYIMTGRRGLLWAALLPLSFGLNLKFTAIAVFGCACAAGCIVALVSRGGRFAGVMAATLLGAALVSIAVLGWNSYGRNTLDHGHPFYPIMGPHRIDITKGDVPASMQGLSRTEALIGSIASRTGAEDQRRLKLPFTLYAGEASAAGHPDTGVGGFGPLFSGALLLAAVAGGALILARPLRRDAAVATTAVVLACALAVLVQPSSYMVRFIPELWLIPAAIGAAACGVRRRRMRWLGWAVWAVMAADAALVSKSAAAYTVHGTQAVRSQLRSLAAHGGHVCTDIDNAHARLLLLRQAGLTVTPLETHLPANCLDDQEAPWTWTAFGQDWRSGRLCYCDPPGVTRRRQPASRLPEP